MQMSINERIKELIKLEKNLGAFSKKIGQYSGTISNMINRGTKPSATVLEAIAKTYSNLNARWLLTGNGQMWLTKEGNIIGNNNQVISGHGVVGGSYNINTTNEELIALREQNKSLQEQLKLKNEQLQLKDELIQLLKEK